MWNRREMLQHLDKREKKINDRLLLALDCFVEHIRDPRGLGDDRQRELK